jgi:preprotein translocase subunit SecG
MAGDSRPLSTFTPRLTKIPGTMFAFLVTLLILDALLLSVVVLLQAGQGGGLASLGGGGTETVLGGRQAVTILTKLSWWCGGIFLALSLVLSLVPRGGNSSALQEKLRAASPAAPAQAPLPLGQPGQAAPAPSTSRPATGSNAAPSTAPAPLPLGAPAKPAPGTSAPQQPKK